ncbi:hypothetical protein [Clostridium sp.]|uniref:hypothetical protein n=1 Tax=Clostridium sp. TaxID=1506 RepID=UPI0029063000|nr:hypothetical protein [Clostridium sp.]MDU3410089.1 hypothetical protein [Clostridium sp.]
MEENKPNDVSEQYKYYAQQMKQIMIDLENMKEKSRNKFYKKYTPEQVSNFLLDPMKYEKQLRDISRYLTVSSPQYYRLVSYLPSIAIIKPIIVPFDTDKIEKNIKRTKAQLKKSMKLIDNMSIQHEFLKIMNVMAREDIFYGYEIETEDSYFIKQLNPEYCRIKGRYDGCFTYEFDFKFFDNYPEELENYISSIDSEFGVKYNIYKNTNKNWQELNVDKEVCMKFQETFDFICPPYVSIFNDLYDIIIYKDMNKQKFENEITTFIGLKMPLRQNSNEVDDFMLEGDTMREWFSFMQSCLGGKVGLFMTPMDFAGVSFGSKNSSNNTNDVVTSAVKNFWGSTGVADVLVGENKNAGTLKYSINTDEALLFEIYRQFERFLSRKIKKESGGMFRVMIPNLTYFNLESMAQRYMVASQYGYNGAISLVEATMGLSQNESVGLGYIENQVLEKHTNMIPVASSHTQSGVSTDNEGGRPTETNDGEVSDSAQQTRDDDSNNNR